MDIVQMSRPTKASTWTKAESRAVGRWKWCAGPVVPGPGCLTVIQEVLRMLSCDSSLDQRRYNACQLENTVCIIFLHMVMCLKPRLLTRKPKELRKSGRPQTCTPLDKVGGPSPCLHASLAPLECSLPPVLNTLQILCLTFSFPSFPQDSPATRTL